MLLLLLFVLPVGYAATLLAVMVHEVLGHGGAAVVLGGSFDGFQIHWDAMGWAWTTLPDDVSRGGRVFHLAAGALATSLGAAAFLLLALRSAGGRFPQLALCVAATAFMLDGSLYMFWSAYGQTGRGDFARIIRLTDSQAWRWGFMIAGGLLTLVFLWVPMTLLVRGAHRWLWGTTRVLGWRRWLVPVVVAVGLEVGIVSFDWDQLVPGLGRLPSLTGVALSAFTAGVLWWTAVPGGGSEGPNDVPIRHALGPTLTAYGVLALLALAVAGSLRHGWHF
jgi:hypothetical protein